MGGSNGRHEEPGGCWTRGEQISRSTEAPQREKEWSALALNTFSSKPQVTEACGDGQGWCQGQQRTLRPPEVKPSRGKKELNCGTTSNQRHGAGLHHGQVAVGKNLQGFWQGDRMGAPRAPRWSFHLPGPALITAQSLPQALAP